MLSTSGIQWFKFLANMNKEVSIKRMFRVMPIKLHCDETKRKKNLVIASRLNLGLWVEFSTKESKRCNFKDCYQRETMINTVVSQPFGVEKPLV